MIQPSNKVVNKIMDRPHIQQKEVIFIFGVSWAEINAAVAMYRDAMPYYSNEFSLLVGDLTFFKPAKVILFLPPRDHAYLLYSLMTQFPKTQFMVITDKFYYSDSVVLELLGVSLWETTNTLFNEYLESKSLCFPTHQRRESLIKEVFKTTTLTEAELIDNLNKYLILNLHRLQLTRAEQIAIFCISRGMTLIDVGRVMGINAKAVSSHKVNALKKLPYGDDRKTLSRSLLIR